jgi:hypothetical protein
MAKYFNYFPKTLYTANNKTSGLDTVTNIIARFGFESKLKENSSAFYKYSIQESDTPEIIAGKYYENPERHWIVLLFNDIVDPQYDWPMQYQTFIDYVDNKYSANNYADTANTSVSGLSWAMNVNNVQAYYKTVTRTSADGTTISEQITVDANTWANVAATTTNFTLQDGTTITEKVTKSKQSYYEYEQLTNEAKREIKLLKKDFVPEVEKEFKKIIKL